MWGGCGLSPTRGWAPTPIPGCAALHSSPRAPTAQSLNDIYFFTHKIAVGSNGDHLGETLNWNLKRQMQGERPASPRPVASRLSLNRFLVFFFSDEGLFFLSY